MQGSLLLGSGTINCIRELPEGKILAAAGDEYPNNGGSNLNNYAALLTLDSTGKVLYEWQWDNETGNTIGGFYVDQAQGGNYLISGNQSVFCIKPTGGTLWKKNYTFSLDGVGTVTNKITRAKVLRNGAIFVAGQASITMHGGRRFTIRMEAIEPGTRRGLRGRMIRFMILLNL